MSPDHPVFEDLSAHHDGEAPEWAEHVAGCEPCRDRLGELGKLTEAVSGSPLPAENTYVGSPPGDDHDDPVTRAVAAATRGTGTGAAGIATRHGAAISRRRWVLAASSAAVLVVSIAVGAVVASKGPHRQMTRHALSAPERNAGSVPDRAVGTGGGTDTVVTAGDLGEIPDRASLVARVGADLRARDQGRAVPAPADTPTPRSVGAPPLAAPAQGVARPCEIEARRDPGDRGNLIYQATALEAGTPAVVLAFGSTQGSGPITVEARARSDCRLLLQGAIL